MFGLIRRWHRSRLVKRPLPAAWRRHLENDVPFYAELGSVERARFEDRLKLFVWEKHFIGGGDLVVTDRMRVVIGAAAVRLVIGLDVSYYDRLTEIIVHPSHYTHEGDDAVVFGEAHDWGTIVLSWKAVLDGLKDPHDGHDTALHEFAHVLDRATGEFNGTPTLPTVRSYGVWARVMSKHFLALQARKLPERRVLNSYGAINEAEFFAVASETFFERPEHMKQQLPELYALLVEFYRFDPGAASVEAVR